MINIEIKKGYLKDKYCMRIGDIEGSTELSNITEEELIEEVRQQLRNLKLR